MTQSELRDRLLDCIVPEDSADDKSDKNNFETSEEIQTKKEQTTDWTTE